jgi:hypothetical protein
MTSEIFVTVVQSYGIAQPPEFIPSIRLTQVCQDWRKIALANPFLWTTLRLKGTGLSPLFIDGNTNEYYVDEESTLQLSESLLERRAVAIFDAFEEFTLDPSDGAWISIRSITGANELWHHVTGETSSSSSRFYLSL